MGVCTVYRQSVVFDQQAEAVAMEGKEYWPLGQFEPGRAAAGASQHEHEPAAITYSEIKLTQNS